MNVSPGLPSEPGSVGDFCTTDRVPKKFHLSAPPPPSFPPMSALGMGLLASGVVGKAAEFSWNQALHSVATRTTIRQTNQHTASDMEKMGKYCLQDTQTTKPPLGVACLRLRPGDA